MVRAMFMLLSLVALTAAGCQHSGAAESEIESPPAPGAFAASDGDHDGHAHHDDDDDEDGHAHHDDDDDDEEDDDERIPRADVPADVEAAALAAVPGLEITAAERETEGDQVVYSLAGTVGGVPHEVEVTAAGTVTEIEVGHDDDAAADD